jgi:hypothetical protein
VAGNFKMTLSFPSAPLRFAALTSTARWGRKENQDKSPTNNQTKSTKFISGLDLLG